MNQLKDNSKEKKPSEIREKEVREDDAAEIFRKSQELTKDWLDRGVRKTIPDKKTPTPKTPDVPKTPDKDKKGTTKIR